MRLLSLIALTLAVLVGLSFAVLNGEFVVINYYIGSKKVPLSLLILGVWAFGIVVGWLASLPALIRLKLELRRFYRERT